jgi:hypothetical protein
MHALTSRSGLLLILLGVLVVHGAEGASTHAGSLTGAATAAVQSADDHRMQLVASPGEVADRAASGVADTDTDHGSGHSEELRCLAIAAPTSATPDGDTAATALTIPVVTDRNSDAGPSTSGPGSRPPPCRALSLAELSVFRV